MLWVLIVVGVLVAVGPIAVYRALRFAFGALAVLWSVLPALPMLVLAIAAELLLGRKPK